MTNMKKYIRPEASVIEVRPEGVLALSAIDKPADGSEVLSGRKGWDAADWSGDSGVDEE